jgi:isoamylase
VHLLPTSHRRAAPGAGARMSRAWPGEPSPLGARHDGIGTNFSVYAEAADGVELCLFGPGDDGGDEERIELTETHGGCWHAYLPDVTPGQRYGYRVHGPWDPANGQRFNPAKLLIDPYAMAIEGGIEWGQAVFGHQMDDPDAIDTTDSAPAMPRSVVVNPFFDWEGDSPPRTQWSDTVIYEAHVKGATQRHPDIPEELRGSYTGVAHPAFIEHLTSLGITAVELLPIHQFVHDHHLVERGLRNYWGYSSIGYLAPHNEYGHRGELGQQVQDVKQMVKDLHAAGIEVILDVVYNHTAEGNHLGPTLCFKGFDNAAYYRLSHEDPRYYVDYTGTGNTLNARHPHVLQLIMDSLRYWVEEMHVDGFRFDLASTLARGMHDVDRLSAFFDLIHQDPVVNRVKLIAEPWDVGEGGYQVGGFPPLWAEWNGKYRDTVRELWAGTELRLGEVAYRLTGSSDLYETSGRRPAASINFVTAHDGFTLRDLVSYNEKHNEANVGDEHSGEDHNRSWNCGVEGPTDDPDVLALRARQQRNMLATLLLSQGVPMLLGGDELGRTQGGNNNGYCQDTEISWFDWDDVDRALCDFTADLIRFRLAHPTFRRRRFFEGRPLHGSDMHDLAWFGADGTELSDDVWDETHLRQVTMFINGDPVEIGRRGELVTDDSFLLVVNAHHEPVPVTMPPKDWGSGWKVVLDTATGFLEEGTELKAGDTLEVTDRSLVLLQQV